MTDVRPAVFLDRDGTLIEGEGYLGDPDGVRPIEGVREALQVLRERGWLRIIVTNQSGVARGYFTADDYAAVSLRMAEELGEVDASYACFHLPEGAVAPWNIVCRCRKPLPGMIEQAAAEHCVDLSRSVLVGDDIRDLLAARAGGVEPILVRTGKGRRSEARLVAEGLAGVRVFDSLAAVVAALPSVASESTS